MFNSPMDSPVVSPLAGPWGHGQSGVPGDPIALWMERDGFADSGIGLSISELYPLVDPVLQSIVSADGGTTKRDDADIVALALVSAYLNYGTMFGRDGYFVAFYQLDTPTTILSKAAIYAKSTVQGTQFQNGEIIQFQDASPMEF